MLSVARVFNVEFVESNVDRLGYGLPARWLQGGLPTRSVWGDLPGLEIC
jgi:hypothetical protein